jgi:hypothetical protein
MLIYIIFLILIFIVPLLGKFKLVEGIDSNGLQATFFIIFLFSALRFDVGYDYSMYYELIEGNIKYFEDQINRIEYLPRKIIFLSSFLGFSQLFFIISSFIITFFFYKAIKENSLDPKLSTLIFICFPIFFYMSLSVVRQYIAIAMIFYGFRFIKERKILHFFCLVLLAMLFHKSAIIALPLYFLYGNFYINKKIIVFIYILSFFSSKFLVFFVTLLSERYAIYINGIGGQGGNLILIFFQLIGLLLLPIVYNLKDKEDKEFNFYVLCYYVGLFIWASLSRYGHAGIRGSLYFICFTIVLIPQLKNKIKEYYLIRQSMLIVCFVFFFFNLYLGSKHRVKDANLPYKTFFFKTTEDLKPND